MDKNNQEAINLKINQWTTCNEAMVCGHTHTQTHTHTHTHTQTYQVFGKERMHLKCQFIYQIAISGDDTLNIEKEIEISSACTLFGTAGSITYTITHTQLFCVATDPNSHCQRLHSQHRYWISKFINLWIVSKVKAKND